MFRMEIGGVATIFTKFFTAADKAAVLGAVPLGTTRVVFVDTGATPVLAETVAALVERGIEVVVRDHHRGEGRTPEAAEAIETMLGDNALIVTREQASACSQIIEAGEFAGEGTVIVADPDPDGLTAAMKAAGVTYEGLDADAAVLDGPRSEHAVDRLTPVALLLSKSMATLPPVAEKAKEEIFYLFLQAACFADGLAYDSLGHKAKEYEAAVREAEALAATATQPVSGVVMVDAAGKPRHDLATLVTSLEAREGCRVTVVRKDNGPIAAKHNIQYSMAVVKARQADLDLRDLVPEGQESSPEAGLLSNTSFLLHCSEKVWQETILPVLRERLG